MPEETVRIDGHANPVDAPGFAGRSLDGSNFAVDAFLRWATQAPEAIAAIHRGESLSYRELDVRSQKLSRRLSRAGVGRGVVVAVCVSPGFDVLVGLLAILKSGGVYLPLDPTHPEALIVGILEEAQPSVILTQSAHVALVHREAALTLCLDADRESIEAENAASLGVSVGGNDPAYLLYTSGTTGKPKGVLATQGNLAHYLAVARQEYRFSPSDVFCSLARYTFSISLFELLSPLTCGGRVLMLSRDEVLSPERLSRILEEITVLHAGPSLLTSLFHYLHTEGNPVFPGVRHVSSGGDRVPPQLMAQMAKVFPTAEVYVIYGCTEISCMGTTFAVNRAALPELPLVGRPFPGVSAYIVDDQGNPVSSDDIGEICFAGAGVVSGYWERPQLDQEKFVELMGQRYYRTGDVGRWAKDGSIEMLGRRDFQIQLRGIRIELMGIENTVCELGLARQCAVAVKRVSDQDDRLVCFLVEPSEGGISRLRQELGAKLPDYMVPQCAAVIDALPVTLNGKLDRVRLQEMANQIPLVSGAEKAMRAPPRNPTEQQIIEVFATTLGCSGGAASLGIDDDFFELGGHSLLAVQLAQSLENALGMEVPAGVIFENPTVRALALRIRDALPSQQRPILLSRSGRNPSLFLLAGVHLYRPLAHRLAERYSVYGVYAGNELMMFESPNSLPSVRRLAEEYGDMIRRQQPHGPYRIGGLSFGGIVAYELAHQLRAAGETVSFVGLLDSVLPELGWRRHLARFRRLLSLPPGRLTAKLRSRALERWGLAVQVGRRRLPKAIGPATVNPSFIRHASDHPLRSMEDVRQEAYSQAAASYMDEIRPWSGPVTLIVAGRRFQADELGDRDCGWATRATALTRHTINCEHLELVEEPHVAEVARLLAEALRQGDQVATMAGESPVKFGDSLVQGQP